jgi:hypothetical protein
MGYELCFFSFSYIIKKIQSYKTTNYAGNKSGKHFKILILKCLIITKFLKNYNLLKGAQNGNY